MESSRTVLGHLWGFELEMPPSLQCPVHQGSTHSPSQKVHIIRFLDDTGVPRDSSREQQPWTHGELRLLPESKQELLGRKRGRRENQTKQSLGKQDSSKKPLFTEPLEPGESDTGPAHRLVRKADVSQCGKSLNRRLAAGPGAEFRQPT